MIDVDRQWIAAKAFIVRDGKVLILREAKTAGSTQVGYYQVPGGRVELGESFFDALIREADEETSLKIKPVKPLAVLEWSPTIKTIRWQVVAVYYLCTYISGEVVLSHEHDDFKWINPADFNKHHTVSNEHQVYKAYINQL